MKELGYISAILMPLFDIPLIVRIIRRKSSEDISLTWVIGIEACILGMLPAGITSVDPMMRAFTVVNTLLFTAVTIVVLCYHPSLRRKSPSPR